MAGAPSSMWICLVTADSAKKVWNTSLSLSGLAYLLFRRLNLIKFLLQTRSETITVGTQNPSIHLMIILLTLLQ